MVVVLCRDHGVDLGGLIGSTKEFDLCRSERGLDEGVHAKMLEYLNEWSDIVSNRDP